MRKAILEKQKKVEELVALIKQYKTVAIATVDGVPANLLQQVRKRLHGKALMKVAKKAILERALKGSGHEHLVPYLEGTSAVILTNMSPVELYREVTGIRDHKYLSPGKPTPVDVVLQPGPAGVPATMISELKAAGIPVKMVKGAVYIEKEVKLLSAGDVVPPALANALMKMGVRPVEVFVRINAAESEGLTFTRDVLSITPEIVGEWVKTAAAHAFNLAYNAGYPTPDTLPLYIADAHRKTVALAVNIGYVARDTVRPLLAKAHAQALALVRILPDDALDEELKQLKGSVSSAQVEKQEERKEEEKEEKEEKAEEDVSAGLASLFG